MPERAAHIADAGFSLRSLKLASFPPFSKARKQRPPEVEPLECCDGGTAAVFARSDKAARFSQAWRRRGRQGRE